MAETAVNAVPDGDWGWVIVAAVAFIHMTNQSMLSVFGQLFGKELEGMEQDTFTTALITNLNSLVLNFSGLLIGPVIKGFTPRSVSAFGCVLVSIGLLICSLASQLWHFILGYGCFVGLGLGLISPSTFITINSYFKEKRGRAVGCSMAGAGLGQVLMPHVVRYSLENYGFRAAMRVLSCISLAGVFGAVFLKTYRPPTPDDENFKHLEQLLDVEKQSEKLADKQSNSFCHKFSKRLAQAMDLSLLKDAAFLNIIVGIALVYTTTINFTMIFPTLLQSSLSFSSATTATCMSVVAGADISFRLLLPCFTDRLHVPYRLVFLLGAVGLFLTRTALAEITELVAIIGICMLTGIAKSATVINNNLVISAHCQHSMLAGGLGLNMISKGVLVMTVGQLLGWVRDYTGSYAQCLLAQNICLLLVIVTWLPELYYQQRRKTTA